MKHYKSRSDAAHVLQFDAGDDLLGGVHQFIEEAGVSNGVVVSGIGTLDRCRMHMVTTVGYPPVEVFPEWNGLPLELTSMQGVIANETPHIHMNVSDTRSAVGGHLEPGCRVLYLAEVVVLAFDSLELDRVPDANGVLTLVSAEGSNQ